MPKNEGLKKLEKAIGTVYLIKDTHITELLLGTTITQFLPNDPVWPVIVAPSGGGKTEFLNMLSLFRWTPPGKGKEEQKVYPVSTLTAHTLISGFKSGNKEPSLLTQVNNGYIIFKDLTSLLSEHPDERAVIMAQLREIYDGKYNKKFGTGEEIKWRGKITVIAGATQKIHSLKQAYTAMGERFIFYNLIQPDREEAADKTMLNQEEGLMNEHRQKLAEMFAALAKDILDNLPTEIPKLDSETRKDTIALAELATRARSEVERNWRSPQQDITEVHSPEMPTRFAGQLQSMIQAFKIITHHETGSFSLLPRHKEMINKLALDSVTKIRRIVMQELSKYDTIETPGLAAKINLPTNSVRKSLEDLVALEIATRIKGKKADQWIIKPHYRELMARFEGIKNEGGELTEDNAKPDERLATVAEEAMIEEELAKQPAPVPTLPDF